MGKKMSRVSITDRMVLAGFGFAAIYWFIDTFVYIIFSYEFNFFQRLIGPDLTGTCNRLIVLCLFIMFGAHAQFTINERKHAEEELLKHRRHTDEQVEKRTADLKAANEKLKQEIADLKQKNK